MQFITLLFCLMLAGSEEMKVEVPAPDFKISQGNVLVEGGAFLHPPGAPNLPCRNLTIAVPPGAIVEAVEFSGSRKAAGTAVVQAAKPPLPLSGGEAAKRVMASCEKQKRKFYASDAVYPEALGTLLSKGGLRKYTLITVACHHFGYEPQSRRLYCAPEITVSIKYRMPAQGSERHQYWNSLIDDCTFDGTAKELIYNWKQAKKWYTAGRARKARGYYIIAPTTLQNSVDALVAHRQGQGYDVKIVTKEYIAANSTGIDMQEKIRNYLRANVADISFALLVGVSTQIPWRSMVPFNNNYYSPYGGPDYSPIPADLYYAELTDPDYISWNSDGDSYYGEVFTDDFLPIGDDDPDYHADIHLGRIPMSSKTKIQDVCAKIIAFDKNKDVNYKTSALLTGAFYYFENENYSGNDRLDGADFMEELMDDGVLDRSNSVYLYETDGLDPCYYSCTAPLTQANHVAYWQNKGIMYECHHGNYNVYARKVWAWDDGDGVPESNEIQWPTSLYITDVTNLDNVHPATAFLRSCLCGKPEATSLGSQLLYRGASAVISSSRVSWLSGADRGGIPYHFYERLLKRKLSSGGLIGPAYDLARNDFMRASGFWLPAYHYNLFGDPATRQFGKYIRIDQGQLGGIEPATPGP
ncbi:MAG: C25 family cysteine peptidase [Planctomycetota bacterium]|jgi:hypothetical protein